MSDPLVEILDNFSDVDTDINVQVIYNGYIISFSGNGEEGEWTRRSIFVPDTAAIKVFFALVTDKVNI